MYISLAVHKKNLVIIDSMESFTHYFCLAKKQKMTPLASSVNVISPEELEEEIKPIYEEGAEVEETTTESDDDVL